jgi:hypothetical protein
MIFVSSYICKLFILFSSNNKEKPIKLNLYLKKCINEFLIFSLLTGSFYTSGYTRLEICSHKLSVYLIKTLVNTFKY